jgi:hypothetical protein
MPNLVQIDATVCNCIKNKQTLQTLLHVEREGDAADQISDAVYEIYCILSLEKLDREFESYCGHGCMSMFFFVYVLLLRKRALVRNLFPFFESSISNAYKYNCSK